ncbi:MAG: right-handed parallel beta-helix repeat-containing protein [Hyphomicrobium sp.]
MMFKAAAPVLAFLMLPALMANAAEPSGKWGAWLDAGGFYSNHDESRGESTLWAPLWQSPTSVFFFEGEGKLFEESQREGNFALGYRQMLASGWNLGAWGGYDIRSTSLGSTFGQVSGGLEALSTDWDFRLNGYVPLNDSEVVSESSQQFGGARRSCLTAPASSCRPASSRRPRAVSELAFGGVDSEIGLRLPVEKLAIDPRAIDLRIYAGGFYFENPDAGEAIAGPKARAELRINDIVAPGSRLTLEASFTSDDVRGEEFEGRRAPAHSAATPAGAGFAEPSGSSACREQLRRDTDIVSSTKTTTTNVNTLVTEAVEDAATNVDLNKVAYVDGNTAGGISGVSTAQGAKHAGLSPMASSTPTPFCSRRRRCSAAAARSCFRVRPAAHRSPSPRRRRRDDQRSVRRLYHDHGVRRSRRRSQHRRHLGCGRHSRRKQCQQYPDAEYRHRPQQHRCRDARRHRDGVGLSRGDVQPRRCRQQHHQLGGHGVNTFQTSDVVIRDNQISGTTTAGINVQTGLSALTIAGNTITTSGGEGIALGGTGMTGVSVVGNTITSQAGIIIFSSASDGTISNNTFDTLGVWKRHHRGGQRQHLPGHRQRPAERLCLRRLRLQPGHERRLHQRPPTARDGWGQNPSKPALST